MMKLKLIFFVTACILNVTNSRILKEIVPFELDSDNDIPDPEHQRLSTVTVESKDKAVPTISEGVEILKNDTVTVDVTTTGDIDLTNPDISESLTGIKRFDRRKRQSLTGILGSISRILNVTSSLSNAFNRTREAVNKLRNLKRRICIDCASSTTASNANVLNPSVLIQQPPVYSYDYYYDYLNDYLGRKKRNLDAALLDDDDTDKSSLDDDDDDTESPDDDDTQLLDDDDDDDDHDDNDVNIDDDEDIQVSNEDTAIERPKRLVANFVGNFIKIEIIKRLENITPVIKQKIGTFFAQLKIRVKNWFDSISNRFGLNREKRSLDILPRLKRDTSAEVPKTDTKEMAMNPEASTNSTVATSMTLGTSTMRTSTGGAPAMTPGAPAMVPPPGTTFEQNVATIVNVSNTVSEIVDKLGDFTDLFVGILDTFGRVTRDSKDPIADLIFDISDTAERIKRDIFVSPFDVFDYFFTIVDHFGRKRRSVDDGLVPSTNLTSFSQMRTLRTKRFTKDLLNLSEIYADRSIDFFQEFALKSVDALVDYIRKKLDNFNLEAITKTFSKRSIQLFEVRPFEITRLKRGIFDILSSVENITAGTVADVADAVRNSVNIAHDLIDTSVRAAQQLDRKRSVNNFGDSLSDAPEFKRRLMAYVSLLIERLLLGALSNVEISVNTSLDTAHEALSTSLKAERKKRDADLNGNQLLNNNLPTSEELTDFFTQLENRIDTNFRAIESNLEQLRTLPSHGSFKFY